MANRLFQNFGKENVGEFTIANFSYFGNLEFGWVKCWRMMFILPNSPKLFPAKVLRCTVSRYYNKSAIPFVKFCSTLARSQYEDINICVV